VDTTTGDAFVRMQQLVQSFTTPDICLQLNTSVNNLAGKYILGIRRVTSTLLIVAPKAME